MLLHPLCSSQIVFVLFAPLCCHVWSYRVAKVDTADVFQTQILPTLRHPPLMWQRFLTNISDVWGEKWSVWSGSAWLRKSGKPTMKADSGCDCTGCSFSTVTFSNYVQLVWWKVFCSDFMLCTYAPAAQWSSHFKVSEHSTLTRICVTGPSVQELWLMLLYKICQIYREFYQSYSKIKTFSYFICVSWCTPYSFIMCLCSICIDIEGS